MLNKCSIFQHRSWNLQQPIRTVENINKYWYELLISLTLYELARNHQKLFTTKA